MQQIMDTFSTNPYGVKVPHTTCRNVSVGGFYQSGGFHSELGAYGFASDHIVGVRMVLNDGSVILIYDKDMNVDEHILLEDEQYKPDIIKVQNKHKKDLLWAIKGSGAGSFGVVTRYYIQSTPLPQQGQILAFELCFLYALDTAVDVFRAYTYFRKIADTNFNIDCNLNTISDPRLFFNAMLI